MLRLKRKDQGLVTIVSVIIIVIIISIITLSLATLTRRNLRQSLDEQLSTQAQYAAESGINAAIAKINNPDPAQRLISNVTSCDSTGPGKTFDNQNLANTADGSVKYTCILVDFNSTEISTDLTKVESMKVYRIIDSNPDNYINRLTITWSDPNNQTPNFTTCSTSDCLTNAWGTRLGLLRVRLIPYPSSGFSRSSINSGLIDIVAYPFPTTLSSDVDLSTGAKNYVVSGECKIPPGRTSCDITISNLYNADTNRPGKYYVQLYSYYTSTTNVKISGTTDSTTSVDKGSPVKFSGAQATIDSTGVSQDVVKRLKVKVSFDKTNELPVFALGVGDNLCKKFTTSSAGTQDPGNALPTKCPAF